MVETILSNKKIDQIIKSKLQRGHLSQNDLWWLISRGGRSAQDVDIDEFGRWFLKETEEEEKKWGRTYLPNGYAEYIPDTSCMKFDKTTGNLYFLSDRL